MPRRDPLHCPRRLFGALWATCAVTSTAQPLWAQAPTEEAKADWVVAYALVGLCIGLALYSICRPAARRKRS